MKTVTVNASRQYEIRIESGLLQHAGEYIAAVHSKCTCMLVSDETVWALYGTIVKESLENSGFSVHTFIVNSGEISKSTQNLIFLWETLAEKQLTRSDLLVALGGGVVGDLTGFAAATYLRGIDYVQIPTTLLAMVDSSVGGKTAVDLAHGKNLAGAFYQPCLVLCDTAALNTLAANVYADGMAEVIKYGFINHPTLLQMLKNEDTAIEDIIALCVQDKKEIVEADERDNACRQLLNLGHTLAHGIELHSGYTVSHGSAVAIGMTLITKAAVKAGLCEQDTLTELLYLLQKYDLPTSTAFTSEQLCAAALEDKKRKGDFITLVIPVETGKAELKKIKIDELQVFIDGAWEDA